MKEITKDIKEDLANISKGSQGKPYDLRYKDERLLYILHELHQNIAQFFSVDTNLNVRCMAIKDTDNSMVSSFEEALEVLYKNSRSGTIGVRAFSLERPKGNSIIIDIPKERISEVISKVKENAQNGLISIINETIKLDDSGVSGVILGDVYEFAPGDTPKCVEKEGVCRLPSKVAKDVLFNIYENDFINSDIEENTRVEFSIHPRNEGYLDKKYTIWEVEDIEDISSVSERTTISWSSKFSEFLGDKVFGLLVANSLGFNVPYTTVVCRNVAPFRFGTMQLNNDGVWVRTAPRKKEAGKFQTVYGWTDIFRLMKLSEMEASSPMDMPSIMVQEAVRAEYSGAAIVGLKEQEDIIEGVSGAGDNFMIGERSAEELPINVINYIKDICDRFRNLQDTLGQVSFEWAFSKNRIWVLQLNQIKSNSSGTTIVPCDGIDSFIRFNTDRGLEELRKLIETIKDKTKFGIILEGDVGVTSHFGDVLRKEKIPSYIERKS